MYQCVHLCVTHMVDTQAGKVQRDFHLPAIKAEKVTPTKRISSAKTEETKACRATVPNTVKSVKAINSSASPLSNSPSAEAQQAKAPPPPRRRITTPLCPCPVIQSPDNSNHLPTSAGMPLSMAVSLASSAFIEIFETSSTLWLAPFLAGARVGARRVFFKTPDTYRCVC